MDAKIRKVNYMDQSILTVDVAMDSKVFSDFARFDSFRASRRWVRIVIFSLFMLLLGVFNLFTGATLLFWVLLVLAFLTLLSYGYQFYKSVRIQILQFDLQRPKHIYTFIFDSKSEKFYLKIPLQDELSLRWSTLFAVYRVKNYLYFYTSKQKAYMLPLKKLSITQQLVLWELCKQKVPKEALHDKAFRYYHRLENDNMKDNN